MVCLGGGEKDEAPTFNAEEEITEDEIEEECTKVIKVFSELVEELGTVAS